MLEQEEILMQLNKLNKYVKWIFVAALFYCISRALLVLYWVIYIIAYFTK